MMVQATAGRKPSPLIPRTCYNGFMSHLGIHAIQNGDKSMSLEEEIKKAIGDHGIWKKTLKNAVDTEEGIGNIFALRGV
jgi:hypothetical protein